MSVRPARDADEPAWRHLWAGYCDFYGAHVDEAVTGAVWRRLVDAADPQMSCLVAVVDGRVAGFANYVVHPRTWSTGDACYLEDLFVAPEHRGRGAGRALIEALVERAGGAGWSRLYWHTERDNRAARAVYDAFASADRFVRYVLDTQR